MGWFIAQLLLLLTVAAIGGFLIASLWWWRRTKKVTRSFETVTSEEIKSAVDTEREVLEARRLRHQAGWDSERAALAERLHTLEAETTSHQQSFAGLQRRHDELQGRHDELQGRHDAVVGGHAEIESRLASTLAEGEDQRRERIGLLETNERLTSSVRELTNERDQWMAECDRLTTELATNAEQLQATRSLLDTNAEQHRTTDDRLEEHETLQARHNNLNEAHIALRTRHQEIQRELDEVRDANARIGSTNDLQANNLVELRRVRNDLLNERTNLSAQVETLTKARDSATADAEAAKQAHRSVSAELDAARKRITELDNSVAHQLVAGAELTTIRNELFADRTRLSGEVATLTEKRESAEATAAQAIENRDALDKTIETLRAEADDARSRISTLETTIEAQTNELDGLRNRCASAEQKESGLRARSDELVAQIVTLQEERNRAESEFDSVVSELQRLTDDLDQHRSTVLALSARFRPDYTPVSGLRVASTPPTAGDQP